MKVLLVFSFLVVSTSTLDNGLALTPPMGWMSWERFRCNIDCKNDPNNCISEKLYMKMADLIVSEGYKDVGYQYVSIDDCWSNKSRDAQGKLHPDSDRFPSGILNLAKYMHSKGLKLGIYGDFGSKTCARYPGSEFHMKEDADTFAEWEVDMLKFDACNSDLKDMDVGFPTMSFFLNQTGRPILLDCEWAAAEVVHGIQPNYHRVKQYCNLWRNYVDIQDSWESVLKILAFYGNNKGGFAQVAGPGGFNDPDELLVGDFGLSYEQQKVQFGMWALMASPLLMSVDLRTINPNSKAILQNKRVIAINQDPLGAQGYLLYGIQSFLFWLKPLANKGSYAFAVVNLDNQGMPRKLSIPLKNLQLTNPKGYNITEAFDGIKYGVFKPSDTLSVQINPTSLFLATAELLP